MTKILEIIDKTKRKIYITNERYKHILRHPEMQNKIEEIKDTIQKPLKITDYPLEDNIKLYYKYYKNMVSGAKYLRVVVKYLNGEGFIVTAYFIDEIR